MNWTAIGSSGIPFARLAFAGTFLLASAGALIGMQPRPVAASHAQFYQLVLKPDREAYPREYFASQWGTNAPVILSHDGSDNGSDKARVEFTRRWPMVDGCWWESTETLDPISPTQYHYLYQDHQVSCPDRTDDADDEDLDRTQWIPSQRTGTVDVVPIQ